MWDKFKHWLLHKLTPHCPECLERDLEFKICNSCETLKGQLDIAAAEKRQLLSIISELTHKAEEPTTIEDTKEMRPIRKLPLTWRAQRQILERESKVRASREQQAKDKIVKDATVPPVVVKSVEELEKEMGVTQDA